MNIKRKNTILYFVLVILAVVLINTLFKPMVSSVDIQEVPYSQFLLMLENGEIDKADIYDDNIIFTTKPDSNGVASYYSIAYMKDNVLADRLYEAGVEFTPVFEKESLISVLLSWVIPFAGMAILWIFIMRLMSSKMGGQGGAMSFGKNTAKIYVESKTGKTFADVAGQDEAKESLMELVDFLKNPGRYTEIGAQLPKGALLVGPPGTGKTLLAKAVAGESGVPFFSITGSEFVEMFVGVGASRVRDLFKQAMEKAPCIVFIDEIDAIGKTRNSGQYGGNDEREQTLNQLLSEMDGFDSSKGVIILAATNRPEVLDKALLRPGRFDRRIIVDKPDLNGREEILKVHAKAIRISSDVDLRDVARSTSGLSGAELANIINEAAINAVRNWRNVVEQNDLLFAVDLIIAGAEKKSSALSDKEKRIVAYHEIGHALVSVKVANPKPVQKITIVPRTMGALGFTMSTPEEDRYLLLKDEALDQIRILLAGRSAEEVKFHTVSTGAANDIERATKLARDMVTRYGMSEHFDLMALSTVTNPYLGDDTTLQCSQECAAKADAEVLAIIRSCHDDAKRILMENERLMDVLTAALLDHETLQGDEFAAIIENYERSKYNLPPADVGIKLGPATQSEQNNNPETEADSKQKNELYTEANIESILEADSKSGTESEKEIESKSEAESESKFQTESEVEPES